MLPGKAHWWAVRPDGVEDGQCGEAAGGAHWQPGPLRHEPAQICLWGKLGLYGFSIFF